MPGERDRTGLGLALKEESHTPDAPAVAARRAAPLPGLRHLHAPERGVRLARLIRAVRRLVDNHGKDPELLVVSRSDGVLVRADVEPPHSHVITGLRSPAGGQPSLHELPAAGRPTSLTLGAPRQAKGCPEVWLKRGIFSMLGRDAPRLATVVDVHLVLLV